MFYCTTFVLRIAYYLPLAFSPSLSLSLSLSLTLTLCVYPFRHNHHALPLFSLQCSALSFYLLLLFEFTFMLALCHIGDVCVLFGLASTKSKLILSDLLVLSLTRSCTPSDSRRLSADRRPCSRWGCSDTEPRRTPLDCSSPP